jgi:NAD+ synthase
VGADGLRIAIFQMNPTVGDIEGNREAIVEARRRVPDADLLVCPELCLSGYPPEDLVLREAYVEACRHSARLLAEQTTEEKGPALIVGTPWPDDDHPSPRPFNALLLIDEGEIKAVSRKVRLPNYGPFDEPRTFKPGPALEPVLFRGLNLGLMVCEDMWFPAPASDLKDRGADLLIVPHGSPFRKTVHGERKFQAEARARETGLPVMFVNQCGGQDELVFDGGSFVLQDDEIAARMPLFREGLAELVLRRRGEAWRFERGDLADWEEGDALIYQALMIGTRDYVRKSGFRDVVLGLSGGIDSALVAAVAADALGPEHVHCVRLPSRYTSEGSMSDAEELAELLGLRLDTVPIEPAVDAIGGMLNDVFAGRLADLTEENLQSRIRGTTLMAISNKLGSLMLTTGNKSEMAVGYATLYGDMNGAYNPLKDVYKTRVFSLCRWRNAHRPEGGLGPEGCVIPEAIIAKPPSAELRDNQRDDDSLPPYDVLDDILRGFVEDEASVATIVGRGHDETMVRRVQTMLYRAEYKRRQSAPGPKISTKYFGRDRRYPIVNRYNEG